MTAVLVSLDANAEEGFVDIRSVDPTIVVDLRYAGRNNFLRQRLYPRGTRALARPEVASALAVAQAFLHRYNYGLKIWDAYRPAAVQALPSACVSPSDAGPLRLHWFSSPGIRCAWQERQSATHRR